MTGVMLASRLRWATQELIREANRTRNPLTERRLRHTARSLLYRTSAAYTNDPEQSAQTTRLLEDAIDTLADAIWQRTERELEEGTTP